MPEDVTLPESANLEFAQALQALEGVLKGGIANAQNVQTTTSQTTPGQETQGAQAPQDKGAEGQSAADQGAPPQGAQDQPDEVLDIIKSALGEGADVGAPSPEETKIPISALRSKDALDELAKTDPKAAYAAARFLIDLGRARAALGAAETQGPPTGQPQTTPQPTAPQDPYLAQLLELRKTLESSIDSLRAQLEAQGQIQAPAEPPRQEPPPSPQEGDLSWLVSGEKAEPTPPPQQAAVAQTLADQIRRMEMLQRLNIFMQMLQQTQDEIRKQEFLTQARQIAEQQNQQRLQSNVRDVAQDLIQTLNRVATEINRHYGIENNVEDLITRAVRDELTASGNNIPHVLARLALEPDEKQRALLKNGFVREVASLYAKYAKAISSLTPKQQGAAQLPPVAPPSEPRVQPMAEINPDDPFADLTRQFAADLDNAMRYLQGQVIPRPLSPRV